MDKPVALWSAAGDVMLYPEVPIAYAAIVLLGVTGLTIAIEKSANRSRTVRDYLESRPCVLVQDGRIDDTVLKRERTTIRELYAILRGNGALALSQVELAILEVTGEITVVLNDSTPEKRDLIDYPAFLASPRRRQRFWSRSGAWTEWPFSYPLPPSPILHMLALNLCPPRVDPTFNRRTLWQRTSSRPSKMSTTC